MKIAVVGRGWTGLKVFNEMSNRGHQVSLLPHNSTLQNDLDWVINCAGVTGYPTWIINGKKYPGEQSSFGHSRAILPSSFGGIVMFMVYWSGPVFLVSKGPPSLNKELCIIFCPILLAIYFKHLLNESNEGFQSGINR